MSTEYTMKLQSPLWDGHTFTDGAIASGTTTFTSNQVGFIAADVGLPIVINGAGAGGGALTTTIAALVSGTQVTLAAAASTTVTAAGGRMGNGYELPLPCVQDTDNGDSMAAILALFDGNNKVMDFRQLREVIQLVGVLTGPAATNAGYVNAIQMRDEIRRTRAAAARYGANTSATSKSWLNEQPGGGTNWGTSTLPAAEQDSTTTRKEATCRLVYDQYWDPVSGAYKNLFVYGTIANFAFGPRPGATTRTRIPFAVTFLAGSVKVGS